MSHLYVDTAMDPYSLIGFLVLALVLLVIWHVTGKFFPPNIQSLVGIILGIILLLAGLKHFGIWNGSF